VKKDRSLNLVLVAGLLFTLIFIGGCAPAGTGGGATTIWSLLVLLAVFFAMIYFFMIRPVRQRERRHDQMVEQLEKGDIVITAGGIYGEVERIDEDSVILKVESGATIRVTKGGVVTHPEDLRRSPADRRDEMI
jgi:preprotein translocase subunit YajC